MSLYLLYESASGYGLFERIESEEIGQELDQVQEACLDLAKFGKIVKLKAFIPFKTAEHALQNINDVTEGILNDYLRDFLEVNFPKVKDMKKSKTQLGVCDPKIGAAIQESLSIPCVASEVSAELLRGIRLFFHKFIKKLKEGDLEKAQLGLGHSYSRAKVKFNVHRVDNMIIQSIALLDQLDKDINTFAMRAKEWYGWHFPELQKVVNDSYVFARLIKFIGNKNRLTEEHLPALEEITVDSVKARQVLDAARASMGMEVSEVDMKNIETFAERVISLAEYRKSLHAYLVHKMHQVAPNLSALIGEQVGARLISQAGSLTNLSKYPASTVQILGAEKALFRALKTKGNTPKYGLIFHSSFISRANAKNKGRISRYLANKCSIASRIDCFTETPTSKYGDALRNQVEDRLKFYETGAAPKKNLDVMRDVIDLLGDMASGSDEDEYADDTTAEMKKISEKREKDRKKDKNKEKDSDRKDKKDKKEKKDKKDKKEKKSKVAAMEID